METLSNNNEIHIGRFADILMDRWFKRSFGTEANKRLLELLLKELIPEREITELTLSPQEYVNPDDTDKDIRVDIAATDSNGQRFIVELQLARQDAFYERAIFNSSFAVQQQIRRGSAAYDFPPVYFIGIMDFSIHIGSDEVLYRYALRRKEDGELMSDRLQFIFLELPNCAKALTPEAGVLDNFCYTLRNLTTMEERPAGTESSELLSRLLDSAEIATFTAEERTKYINDMTTKRDIINQIAYAKKEGLAEGLEEGLAKGEAKGEAKLIAEKKAIARKLKARKMSTEDIAQITGLSEKEIAAL
ncbi:MAG: Rpn family recombination-promoting nuclease/putative transposase [Bacteroidales bacterium]|nr:Rpn family recombination-promoting nuclease/putative transposase [Bacteroidales bacterium]